MSCLMPMKRSVCTLSAVLLVLAACAREPSAPSVAQRDAGAAFGKNASTAAVTSVSPDTGSLATTLDVRIRGSGFREGAVAAWAFDGVVDTTQVRVNGTTYVSSRELVANVTISSSARSGKWDVVVTMSGKTGVGTESVIGPDLFEVLDPSATWMLPIDDWSLALRSDGKYGAGGWSVYANGVCGVFAKIYATSQFSNSGDATMRPHDRRAKCADYPRTVTLVYDDGVVETNAHFMNVNEVQNTAFRIAIGTTVARGFMATTSRCNVLSFGSAGGDSVLVTRVDASTWNVASQPYPTDRAYCTETGTYHHMPVRFRIVSSRPLD